MEIDADAPVVARQEIVVRAPIEIVRGQAALWDRVGFAEACAQTSKASN